jgi:predicted DCC family thiol-disulfide oxidoreductase YuxK
VGVVAERTRPELVFDGDCGFCVRWIARWKRLTGERVDYAPYQTAGERFPDVPTDEFRRSVWLFEPDGRRSRAAEAVCRSLAVAQPQLSPSRGSWRRPWRWPLALYRRLPGARPLMEAGYAFVARHRAGCLRLERLLVGDVLVSTWSRSRAVFRVGLGLVTALALLSLWWQVDGLIGSRGIAPVAQALEGAAARSGVDPALTGLGSWAWESGTLLLHPTLFWFARGDGALHAACAVGLAAALLLVLDVAPALCALLLWGVYLSLVLAGGVFLSFQWDSLLVETLALAVLFLPWRLLPARARRGRPDRAPSTLARLLLWWLLFRFLFESGVVKLTWGDVHWHDLTALSYHYLTQPLPHGLSVFAHALPLVVHQASAFGTFVIELALPFLILAPRRLRAFACAAFVALQVLIGASGNYGFFNLLTIVVCLTLLDDAALAWLGRALSPWTWRARRAPAGHAGAATGAATGGAAASTASTASAAVEAVVPVPTTMDVPAPPAGCGIAPGALPSLPPPGRPEPAIKRLAVALCAVPLFAVGALQVRDALLPGEREVLSGEQVAHGVFATLGEGRPVDATRVLEARLQPFLVVNSYGLFRVMTTTRPEIVIRATLDDETWVELDFRWKPDALDQAPAWAQPHMPRLDWRLWFEALSWERAVQPLRPYRPSPWFVAFLMKLVEAEPAVLDLLAEPPFQGRPPREVRASLFLYTFVGSDATPPDAEDGRWWRRQQLYPLWLPVRREAAASEEGGDGDGDGDGEGR